jgi:hypothetical protein
MKRGLMGAFDVLVLGCLLVGGSRVLTHTREAVTPAIEVGATLGVPALTEGTTTRRVVLFLDVDCDACESAAPFIRTIAERTASAPGIDFEVLSSDPMVRVKEWLDSHHITSGRARRTVRVDRLGVLVFPTFVIVGVDGRITDIAQAVPAAADQEHFLARIDESATEPLDLRAGAIEIDRARFAEMQRRGPLQMVDVRDRVAGETRSTDSARIPEDEIRQRAMAELSQVLPIVIDCRSNEISACRLAGMELRDVGFDNVSILVPGRWWWQ